MIYDDYDGDDDNEYDQDDHADQLIMIMIMVMITMVMTLKLGENIQDFYDILHHHHHISSSLSSWSSGYDEAYDNDENDDGLTNSLVFLSRPVVGFSTRIDRGAVE